MRDALAILRRVESGACSVRDVYHDSHSLADVRAQHVMERIQDGRLVLDRPPPQNGWKLVAFINGDETTKYRTPGKRTSIVVLNPKGKEVRYLASTLQGGEGRYYPGNKLIYHPALARNR